jgi:hypothetical protein
MPFDGAGVVVPDRLNQIENVIQLIDAPEKWCKGRRRKRDGRFCVYGALVEVNARSLTPVLLQAIHEVTGRRYYCVEVFNDDIGTTHAVVLRVLNRARDGFARHQTEACTFPKGSNWRYQVQEWSRASV